MKAISKTFLAMVIGVVCSGAAHAALTQGERDAAFSMFHEGASLYNSLPLDAPEVEVNAAHDKAVAGLASLGVKAEDFESAIANIDSMAGTVENLQTMVGYDLKGSSAAIRPHLPGVRAHESAMKNEALRDAYRRGTGEVILLKAPATETVKGQYTHTKPASLLLDKSKAKPVISTEQYRQATAETLATTEEQVAKNSADITEHTNILEQHHRVLVAAGKELQNIRDTTTDNTTDIAKERHINETQQHFIAKNREGVVENSNNIKIVNAQAAANAAAIDQNGSDIQSVAEYAKGNHAQNIQTKNTVEGIQKQEAIQNGSRVQGMMIAKHNAEQEAIQQQITAQAETIPPAAIDHSKEIAANRESINTTNRTLNDLKKQQKAESDYYEGQIQNLAQEASTAIASDRQQIISTQQRVDSNAAQLSKLNSNFSSLKHTVDENKHEAAAGSSSAMAQANIPQVLNGQTVAIGAGVGGYDGESAIAVGVSFRAADSVTVKATVSDDSQQNVGYGAGVSVGW